MMKKPILLLLCILLLLAGCAAGRSTPVTPIVLNRTETAVAAEPEPQSAALLIPAFGDAGEEEAEEIPAALPEPEEAPPETDEVLPEADEALPDTETEALPEPEPEAEVPEPESDEPEPEPDPEPPESEPEPDAPEESAAPEDGGTSVTPLAPENGEGDEPESAGDRDLPDPEPEPDPEPASGEITYVLNANPERMRFHKPTCRDVDSIKPENRVDFYGTRDEAIALGYVPCGHCKP